MSLGVAVVAAEEGKLGSVALKSAKQCELWPLSMTAGNIACSKNCASGVQTNVFIVPSLVLIMK